MKNDADDIDTYELSVEYSNPEKLFNVGILYARNVRSASDRNSSHDMSIFSQKRFGKVQLGGELVTIREDGRSAAAGLLGQLDYLPGKWNFGVDVALATASSNTNFTFHPNYQPFLLLFRQSLGTDKGPSSVRGGSKGLGVGSAAGIGDGSGALLTKAHISYTFDNKLYTLGSEFGFARLLHKASNAGSALGVETDFHFSQKWYENFTTTYALGLLFPGSAFGNGAAVAWGLQIRGALSF
jgi:hypothetical protein